jgi:hypothetical protein
MELWNDIMTHPVTDVSILIEGGTSDPCGAIVSASRAPVSRQGT